MKTYKDSKEFPLENYERIETTGNFFYMIKGYDDGDNIEAKEDDLKKLYNEIVQEFVISLNAKNIDIIQHGKINQSRIDLMKLALAKDIISLQIESDKIKIEGQLKIDHSEIKELLRHLKIQKSDNLYEQVKFIDAKIVKLQNDILEAESKIEKNNPGEIHEEADINEIITNVELILERTIDLKNTSLYRFGIMQNQAKKKIEQMSKK